MTERHGELKNVDRNVTEKNNRGEEGAEAVANRFTDVFLERCLLREQLIDLLFITGSHSLLIIITVWWLPDSAPTVPVVHATPP